MSRRLPIRSLFVSVFAVALATSNVRGDDERPTWAAPPLDRATSIRDGRTGEAIEFAAFLDALAKADVVFLGETHDDETTHRAQLAIYEGLISRRDCRVVLAMEMFERDVQKHLDDYLAGTTDEPTFLAHARPWGNYRTAYRPLVERARACRLPVVAANFPQPLRRRIAMEGPEVLETLEGDERRHTPAKLFPNTEAYWRRVDNATRGHRGVMWHQGDDQRLHSTQTLWDNAMGDACATALDEHPEHVVLHLCGGFHTQYWDGAVRQLLLRKPDAEVKTVSITPVTNPEVAEVEGAPVSDFVAFVEARAGDLNEGAWSIYVNREHKYCLHLPDRATADAPVPLLIWLSGDGLTARDGLDLWKPRLGDDVAVAVLDAPYRAIGDDFAIGGRWYWPDTFSADMGALVTAVERMWGYILRHYPIDPDRVCLAGEGTGATVAAAVTVLTDRLPVASVALQPRRYAKIKDFPLPLPEFWGDDTPPRRSLLVIGDSKVEDWWNAELAEYGAIGLDSELVHTARDPWAAELQAEDAIRTALDVDQRPPVDGQEKRYLLTENDSPRARHSARLQALWSATTDGIPVAVVDTPPSDEAAKRIPTDILPEAFVQPHALPSCPGPFGGTTVLILPEDATPTEIARWLALEEEDPLASESRLHRVRIATSRGDRGLVEVLRTLQAENRKNILLVPAVFCADPARMRSLAGSVRPLEDQMTFHWLPGLGGRKGALSRGAAVAALHEKM